VVALLLVAVIAAMWSQQPESGRVGRESPFAGSSTGFTATGDAERSFAFYRDVFGIDLARSPFAGAASANAQPEPIRPARRPVPMSLVWDLTNTHGSRFRNVFMRVTQHAVRASSCQSSSTSRVVRGRPTPGTLVRRN
jgi:hypothetical protein